MKRASLLLGIVALMAVMVLTVLWGSPYAPVIEPVRDIEEIWAIEDERTPSEEPLVTALELDGAPLAYEPETNTFYCTLGLDQGDAWPQLHITAPDAQDVTLCFTDDYSYDWCADAIAEGYAYEVMAYTDTQYDYLYIVFTGLPIVSMTTQAEITDVETDGTAFISCYGEEPTVTAAQVRLRGAGSRTSEKKSYHVDFVRGHGRGSVMTDVPLLGQTDDVLLIAGVMDDSLMRDKLSWEMYATLSAPGESYGARQVEYCEVFLNGEYQGVYLMMTPVDDAQELMRTSSQAPLTDSVYRSAQLAYAGDKPILANPMRAESGYEMHYGDEFGEPFAALEAYMALEQEQDDEAFCEQVLACIDLHSILRYYLFVQACGMSDNVYNNMYVWAHQTKDGLRYRFAPWDMDLTWGRFRDGTTGEVYDGLFTFEVAQRMIDLDAGGIVRDALVEQWQAMRAQAFTEEHVQALVEQYTHALNDSGAYARNAQRWTGEPRLADGYEIVAFASQHFATLDALFGALVAQ